MIVGDKNSKRNLYVVVAVVVTVSLMFRLVSSGLTWWGDNTGYDFSQMSIMFIGVPTLITLLVVKYAKKPKTAYGITVRTITLFLLMSSILLGEGTLCIILASPIFYGVGALIVFAREKIKHNKMYSVGILGVLMFALEIPQVVNDRTIHTVETIVVFDRELSFGQLKQSPDFMNNLPDLFKVGFPMPVGIEGTGLEVGDLRQIDFRSSTKGVGALVLEIDSINEDILVFKPRSDNTHIDHWLTWQKISVELVDVEQNKAKVVWTSQYICDLEPGWYFEPIERYAVEVMNTHLIGHY